MSGGSVELTALLRSGADARRGVIRVHPAVLAALGAHPWSPLRLQGARTTGALAGVSDAGDDQRVAYVDELVLQNLQLASGAVIAVSRAVESAAATLTLRGAPEVVAGVPPEVVRQALLGKVVVAGDTVSLLPQDVALPPGATVAALDEARRALAAALGPLWTSVLIEVVDGPAEPAVVTMATVVGWATGAATMGSATPLAYATPAVPRGPSPVGRPAPAAVEVLPGLEHQAAQLREWLDLGLNRTDLLARLGAAPSMGVLLTGPAGSGKVGLVGAVAAGLGAHVVHLWGPAMAADEPGRAAGRIKALVAEAERTSRGVLLVEDVEALAPRAGADQRGGVAPLTTLWREELAAAISRGRIGVVCTSGAPELITPELRHPGLLEHEISVPLPDRDARARLLEHLTRALPLAADVNLTDLAARTPGFVVADLAALVRQAGSAAAARDPEAAHPEVTAADVAAALQQVRPTSMAESSLEIAHLTLDDVGDMAPVKEALTEAVLWPLRFPDTFARLGVSAPRGVLMYGPPGCGKTFLVKALAGSGEANVLSVKGADLMSKWVGESEAGVRELFRRARDAAPTLVFLDEVDALAPVRGQGTDSGVTDRVVAALLTELDGVEELRGVVVVAATNRPDLVDPALTRPGRLERLVYVAPPDAAARGEILRAAARAVPLDPAVDLAAVGLGCEGWSAADLAALVREAAMTAMRRSMAATTVTAADVEAARATIVPSLDPGQVSALSRFAQDRASRG